MVGPPQQHLDIMAIKVGIMLCMVGRKHWLASPQQHVGIMATKVGIMLCMVGRKHWLASPKLHLFNMHVVVRLIHITLPMHMRDIMLCR